MPLTKNQTHDPLVHGQHSYHWDTPARAIWITFAFWTWRCAMNRCVLVSHQLTLDFLMAKCCSHSLPSFFHKYCTVLIKIQRQNNGIIAQIGKVINNFLHHIYNSFVSPKYIKVWIQVFFCFVLLLLPAHKWHYFYSPKIYLNCITFSYHDIDLKEIS